MATPIDKIYPIIPVPKPRMTRSDKWKKRKCVLQYYDFKYQCRQLGMTYETGQNIRFHMPFPKSYSKKKKNEMYYMPHTQKPDIDNLIKALFDAIFDEDKHIWRIGTVEKRWAHKGGIEIWS